MEYKSSTFRHFNCLSLSVLLHSLLIAGLTLAPAMLLKKGNGEGEGLTTIDLSVVDGDENAMPTEMQNMAPVEPIVAQPVVQPEQSEVNAEPAPVVTKPKPEPKPVVKKEAPVKPAVVETAPETVEPQPVVEVAESLNEKKEEEVATPLTQQEIEDAQKLAQNQEPVQETQEQLPAAQELEPQPTPTAQAAAAPANAGEGDQTAGGEQGDSKVASQGSPQNFLSLQQLSGNKPPQYTREMRLNRLEGRGQLTYYVTKDGTVTDIKLTQSTGSEVLDQAAIDAFSKYRFVPGQEGYTVHNFEFALTGPAQPDAGRLRTSKQ